MPENALATAEFEDVTGQINQILILGAKIRKEMRDQIITASINAAIGQVTQMEFTFLDPDMQMLHSGLLELKLPVKYGNHNLEISGTTLQGQAASEQVVMRARPRVVRELKNRRGKKVMKKASPSEFVIQECKAVGAKYVVQNSGKRKQVARDTKKGNTETDDDNRPSSWTTFYRLAGEVGFVVFEYEGTIYFGKPSWLMQRTKAEAVEVGWKIGEEKNYPLQVPICNMSTDSEIVDVSLTLPISRLPELKVGKALRLRGVPEFNDYYIITSIDYSLVNATTISVTATTPDDPDRPGGKNRDRKGKKGKKSKKGRKKSKGRGMRIADEEEEYRGGRALRSVAKYAGFEGEQLEHAVAIAMAESGGDATHLDREMTDSKWGPSVGLFNIRSLREPRKAGDVDRLRDASKLRDPIYNALVVYELTNGGTDWSAWSSYKSGAFRKFYRRNVNYLITNWTPPKPVHPSSVVDSIDGSPGIYTASGFVANALQQARDYSAHGYEIDATLPEDNRFDCAELIEWAAARVDVYIPEGATNQIAYCRSHDTLISVTQALRTRGALLYKQGVIAISLGNGRTIESMSGGYGVRSSGVVLRDADWDIGALIPEMRYH